MVILSNSLFSDDASAKFKCVYHEYSIAIIASVIGHKTGTFDNYNHAVNIHREKEISFLKRRKTIKTNK